MNTIVQKGLALFTGRNKSDHFKFIPASQVILTFSFLLAFGSQVHGQIATTTTLASNKTIFCLNEPVTLTATSDQIIAIGNVQFLEGSTILGNALLDASGNATVTISNLSSGNHTIMAMYEGMAPFNGSISADITLSIITKPVISSHPSQRTVGIGCNATFSVTADDIVPLTYQWRKDGFDIPGANSPSLIINNVLLTDDGIYDVVVSGLCGNTTSDPARLTVTPILNVALTSKTNVICFGSATGMIDITANGGLAPYTYTWSGTDVNASAEDQLGLAAGNYSVILTDANGCSTTPMPINITEPSSPVTVSFDSKSNVLCFGATTGSINISASGGTGPYSFAWTGAGASVNGEDQSGLAAGNYSVIVTDANGCSTTPLPINITEPSSPVTVSLDSKSNVLCFGATTGSINISASGGTGPYSFAWTGAGVSVNGEDQSGLVAGNYSVIVTDANGCSTASFPVTISQPSSSVTVSLNSKTDVLCFGTSTGAINVTPSGGTGPYSFAWTGAGVSVNSEDQSGLVAGNYSVIVTDANGCSTASLPVTITQPSSGVSVSLNSKTNVLCFGATTGSINISASGGTGPYTFAWTGAGVSVNSEDQSGLTVGNYSVVVTDANGCSTASLPVTITQPSSSVTVSLNSKTDVLCFGTSTGAINITPSGGTGPYSFAWTGAGVSINSEDQTGLIAGNYSVLVTDANGCSTASLPVTITQPSSSVTVSLNSKTDVLCFGTATGTINISPSGGTGPYSYSWTGAGVNANSEDQSGLVAGNYSVIVTDANGCSTASLPVTITQPSSGVSVSLDSKTNVLCFGASTGAINITASGSTGPYTYTWTGAGVNAGSEDQTGLAAGSYSVIAKDAIGCSSSSLPVTISQPPAISINNISSNSPVCSDNLLSLSSSATGGTGILNYSWTGPNSFASLLKNPTISNAQTSASGLYILTVTDENGCSASATTNVIITQRSTASISYSASAYCKNNGASQIVTLTGTGNYSGGTYTSSPAGLSINSSNGTFIPSASNIGTYTITYTRAAIDVCGPLSATAAVTITALPVASFSYPGTPYCQNAANPNPVFSGGGDAGNFSSSAGLVFINSATGRINLSASTARYLYCN